MRELLTEFGPVALVWFDTPRLMNAERAQRFTDIRTLSPKTLIDGRLGAAVKRAYRLADGHAIGVKLEDGRPRLVLERPILDPTATVVVVEIEGDAVER